MCSPRTRRAVVTRDPPYKDTWIVAQMTSLYFLAAPSRQSMRMIISRYRMKSETLVAWLDKQQTSEAVPRSEHGRSEVNSDNSL
jgi:hypothetical protein